MIASSYAILDYKRVQKIAMFALQVMCHFSVFYCEALFFVYS